MALRTCLDCNGHVSDRANACPHCGYVYRSGVTVGTISVGTFLGLLAWSILPAVVLFFFLAAIGGALAGAGQ